MESTVISPDGISIAYEVHGDGVPALILVHGWSCDRSYWSEQIATLAREHRVVAVDLAGHGDSGIDRNEWTIESFGLDVATVADALGLQSMILIGHSMGGDVILEAARHLPGRVRGLVWVDTYTQLGFHRTAEQVDERVAPFRADYVSATAELVPDMFPPDADSALVRRITADMAAAPPDIGVATMHASFTYGRQVTTPIEELDLPIMAINPVDPPTDVESLERYGVSVVTMSGVGHFMMLEDPERFNEVLRDVIRQFE